MILVVNRVSLSKEEARSLMCLAATLPEPQFTNGEVREAIRQDYLQMFYASGLRCTNELKNRFAQDLATDETSPGYIVVQAIPGQDAAKPEALALATALCSLVGVPFRVIDDGGLWQEVTVDLSVPPNRFRGIGYNPLHIDVVNSTEPPEYAVLLCIRADPAGGGHTLVSNLQRAVSRLSPRAIAQLELNVFWEGKFYGMSGVGRELNPFPVLERTSHPPWRVRFTAKMTPNMNPGPARDALSALDQALCEGQESFLLQPGQLLILNQRVCCARTASARSRSS